MSRSDDIARRAKLLNADLRAIARTPEGRRYFQERLADHRLLGAKFQRNADDAYHHGYRDAVWELYWQLKTALPRDQFVELIYPVKTEDTE